MITPEQREARRRYMGSSDSAAICGEDEDKTGFDVFAEKVYGLEELPAKEGPIARGNRYEKPLLDWMEEELGIELERNVSLVHSDGIRAANLDGREKLQKRIGGEAKFTSLSHKFGEKGTDHVPNKVLIQTHHQMYVADLELVYVPVLLARFGRITEELFEVRRNEDLIKAIVEREQEFWESYVLPKVPPPLEAPPSLEVLKRIRRVPGSVVAIEPALVEEWEDLKLAAKIAGEKEEAAKAAVLAALGNAEAGDYGDPERWLTYFRQSRTDVDGKALKTARPDVFEQFRRVTEFPVARIVKRK
jgi:predicted phage-related endonuclease